MYKGVLLSLTSSCLFGVLYYFSTLLSPLNGEQIFAWRMLVTLPCVTLILLFTKDWQRVVELWGRIRRRPLLLGGVLLSSILLGVQVWLFLWAPVNGSAMAVSLGYFLMPVCMMVVGRTVYQERLSWLQSGAALLAIAGVANELLHSGSLSWETIVVALGYPLYFVLRRELRTDGVGAMWFEMLFMLPVASWIVLTRGDGLGVLWHSPRLLYLLPVLAVLSATAFVSYISSSKLLPLSLFGLLSYVEPVLLVLAALALGEGISSQQWATYIPIWGGVALLILEGGMRVARGRTRC